MVYGAARVCKGINLRGREAYATVPNSLKIILFCYRKRSTSQTCTDYENMNAGEIIMPMCAWVRVNPSPMFVYACPLLCNKCCMCTCYWAAGELNPQTSDPTRRAELIMNVSMTTGETSSGSPDMHTRKRIIENVGSPLNSRRGNGSGRVGSGTITLLGMPEHACPTVFRVST